MRIVCHEARGTDELVEFTLDHVVRYRGQCHVYFDDEVGSVRTLTVPGSAAFPHEVQVVDDLRKPDHFNLSGFVPDDPKILPRFRFALVKEFTGAGSGAAEA